MDPGSDMIKRSRLREICLQPKSEPDNFVSDEEIRAKFDGLCQPHLNEQDSNNLVTAILALEEANSVNSFMAFSRS